MIKAYIILDTELEDLIEDIQALVPHTEEGKEIFKRIIARFKFEKVENLPKGKNREQKKETKEKEKATEKEREGKKEKSKEKEVMTGEKSSNISRLDAFHSG